LNPTREVERTINQPNHEPGVLDVAAFRKVVGISVVFRRRLWLTFCRQAPEGGSWFIFDFMKKQITKWLVITVSVVVLQGCVAIPPLIQIERKDNNEEILKRLDSIDRRLDRLEEKTGEKSEKK
jgi:hypothetical protein